MKNRLRKFTITALLLLSICVISSSKAFALPALQLYVEGASYDSASETWISNHVPNFVLWVLGDVGAKGTIYDVELAAAYDSNESGTISITPTTATSGQLPWPGDSSTPIAPAISGTGSDTPPLYKNNTAPLPNHGEYGPGISWTKYALGNFTLTDSPIGDYIGVVPTEFPSLGQINAYDITISGYSWVHFDAFDHYLSGSKGKFQYVKAPFSHDAEFAPEPGTLSLLGLGFLGLMGFNRKRKG